MRLRRAVAVAATASALLLAGCTATTANQTPQRRTEQNPAAAAPRLPAKPVPSKPYAVGVRTVATEREGRPLRVTVWYPARGEAGGAAERGARPASGTFPVVLFSHGLNGAPTDFRPLLTRWAAAGFVVAAPAYPYTTRGAAEFNVLDVVNQPADASQALTAVLRLSYTDEERVAATGHSAGGITTVGLFTTGRDKRIDAGVILAGNALGVGTAFTGTPAPLLFVHGANDPLVSYSSGQDVYAKLPWPKAFLTLPGENHADPFLDPTDASHKIVADTTTDFLRWSLYGDSAAKRRLARDAERNGLGVLDDKL